ncbi:unnamed protein product [Chrysodeixis includens]|uniref:Uncharacterized protein n=1 Tax=Chrysodeixis includens TaxID=689277 RepID=A0A9N8KY32_CHRIL|nr:unnamed protein product [Chrysodeixis includens]
MLSRTGVAGTPAALGSERLERRYFGVATHLHSPTRLDSKSDAAPKYMVRHATDIPNYVKQRSDTATSPHRRRNASLAEWSKAPDLSSGSREGAWVRTPHLTKMARWRSVKIPPPWKKEREREKVALIFILTQLPAVHLIDQYLTHSACSARGVVGAREGYTAVRSGRAGLLVAEHRDTTSCGSLRGALNMERGELLRRALIRSISVAQRMFHAGRGEGRGRGILQCAVRARVSACNRSIAVRQNAQRMPHAGRGGGAGGVYCSVQWARRSRTANTCRWFRASILKLLEDYFARTPRMRRARDLSSGWALDEMKLTL